MLKSLLASIILALSSFNMPSNNIDDYKACLEEFNAKYGTSYGMLEDEESFEFYQTMSIDEFNKYLLSIYDGSLYDTESPSINTNLYEKVEITHELPCDVTIY